MLALLHCKRNRAEVRKAEYPRRWQFFFRKENGRKENEFHFPFSHLPFNKSERVGSGRQDDVAITPASIFLPFFSLA
jgi:hypothetical protein